jgi:phosphonate transport system substrate-binding protein
MKNMLVLLLALVLSSMALAQAVDRTGWPREITFATVPTETVRDATLRWQPFIDHLQQRLGVRVVFRPGADYAAVTIAMANRQVDVAYFGPASYLDAVTQAGAQAFAKEDSVTGGDGYYSLIIARRGGPIRTLADARGQPFAFVDVGSTSGFRVPMHDFCTRLNIEPTQYFSRIFFAGTHQNVILGVANGTIPVGATFDLGVIAATREGRIRGLEQEFYVLHRSARIPSSPLAYRRDLPATLRREIQRAILEFNNPEWFAGLGLRRFVAATPEEYESFRPVVAFRTSTCPPRRAP